MKQHILALVALVATAFIAASCGDKRPTLHIYNWGDYMSQAVVEDFEKAFNCHVKVDTFDSNEAMYAKLKTGAGGYDIIVPSSYMARLMREQDMLDDLDPKKIPNAHKYFDKSYANLLLDPTMSYTVPYFVSFTGIGYDPAKVKDFKPSWQMFLRQDLKGQVTLLDDVREVMGCALRTLGYDVNSTDQKQLDEAVKLVMQWKKNIAKFGVDDCKLSLASGEFKLIQNYSGDMLQVIFEKPELKFIIPQEGSTVTFDNFAITKNSRQKELAHAFINYMYDPKVSAKNMDEIMYLSPNAEAVKLVNEKLRSNPAFNISAEERARCTPLADLGKDNEKFNRAWDRIKSED